MSYAAIENSTDSGEPIELYSFVRGAGSWRFNSSSEDVIYSNAVYKASSIQRARISQTTDIFKDNLKITFPRSDEFAFQYINEAPEDATSVTVLRGHFGDGEFSIYWKGRIVSGIANGNTIDLDCTSIYTSIQRPGLRAKYEYGCRHGLYSTRCGIAKAPYTQIGSVAAVNTAETVFTISAAAAKPAGYYTAGMLTLANGNTRFITAHSGASITVNLPLRDAPIGTVVNLLAGCDHLKSTCESKFGNVLNFGGFPYIPIINPFAGGSLA